MNLNIFHIMQLEEKAYSLQICNQLKTVFNIWEIYNLTYY